MKKYLLVWHCYRDSNSVNPMFSNEDIISADENDLEEKISESKEKNGNDGDPRVILHQILTL